MAITVKPRKKGTAVAVVALTDENDTSLTILNLSNACWQLMYTDGTIVNNRSFANCPLTALEWALTDNDLAMPAAYSEYRIIAFKAEYSSTIGGVVVAGLVVIEEEVFSIKDLLSVAT